MECAGLHNYYCYCSLLDHRGHPSVKAMNSMLAGNSNEDYPMDSFQANSLIAEIIALNY